MKVPEKILLSLNPNVEGGKLHSYDKNLNGFLLGLWSYNDNEKTDLEDYAKNIFHFKLIFSMLVYANEPVKFEQFVDLLKSLNEIEDEKKVKIRFYDISKQLIDFYKKEKWRAPCNNAIIDALEIILSNKSSYINKNFDLVIDTTDFNIVKQLYVILDNLKKLEIKEFLESNVLKYQWDRDMSSGEISVYTLFSRLYKLKEENGLKDFILLLDEPDMYLHIEWQRTFIIDLLKFLETEFGNIQVILTSHSPFVISDIPKENIIFLDKEDGKIVIENPKKLDNTFAANIHNLVKNGFFMPNSTIGEFAKSKIEEVIEIINASKYHENKEFCDYIISIVGEPLIKNKLLSMIEEQESIQDKINRRKKEIEELEKELKKNDKN